MTEEFALQKVLGERRAVYFDNIVIAAFAFVMERFRNQLVRNLQTHGDYAVVNYLRTKAHQAGGGHISPVAAYDEETDRFLVLDTASYKYPWFWISAAPARPTPWTVRISKP